MDNSSVISTPELAEHITDPDWLVIDCRFSLSDPDEKENDYFNAHISGAIYTHLNRDLTGKILPGFTGRHPLPSPQDAANKFGQLGIDSHIQVVAYDDQGGGLAAARLWLMLKWLGHPKAAVLDGGWQKWLAEDRPVIKREIERRPSRVFIMNLQPGLFVDMHTVDKIRLDPKFKLIDVRQQGRYRGEIEPIDPVAGHIPGAINIPYEQNLTSSGIFRPAEELRELYGQVLGEINPVNTIFYCGSGVTSAHSVLAIQHSGLGQARLYAGSWSEWILDPARPIAVGPEPA